MALLAALLAGACTAPAPQIRTQLADGGRTIEIVANGAERLLRATLIAPDGARIAAEIAPAIAAASERPRIGVGASGGSSSGIDPGIGISVPLGWLSGGGAAQIESRARIPLPPDATPPYGRLELVFARAGTVAMPAPRR
ncbi:MAG: hypothetical protein ING44_15360 [Telmatospirillum sp.]|nr:hypothetical protein [Telmatospirillum sp.]